jgi:hypothetical protein
MVEIASASMISSENRRLPRIKCWADFFGSCSTDAVRARALAVLTPSCSCAKFARNQGKPRHRGANPNQWQVTPETARLIQHWRHHGFSGVRPFFCQIEAVETAIWMTEVAPFSAKRQNKRQASIDAVSNAPPKSQHKLINSP